MLILDTDHLSILDRDTIEAFNLGRRLASVPSEEVVVTIITYEEQMRGWLAVVAQARTAPRQVEAYRKLRRFVDQFRRVNLLNYEEATMSPQTVEERLSAVEAKLEEIAQSNNQHGEKTDAGEEPRGWQRLVGRFAGNPLFESAVRRGREWRESEEPAAEKTA